MKRRQLYSIFYAVTGYYSTTQDGLGNSGDLMSYVRAVFSTVANYLGANSQESLAVTLWTILVATTVFSAVSVVLSWIGVVATQMSLKDLFLIIGNYILAYFAARRKDKMGQVFDEVTGKPVAKAMVELFRFPEMKLVSTALSDKNGHYYFIVKTGSYVISVIRPGYMYPSLKAKTDAKFGEMYIGQVININQRSGAINASIPIDPVNVWGNLKRRPSLSLIRSKWFRYFFMTFGTVLTVYNLVMNPGAANYLIAAIFMLLWILEFTIINRSLKFSTVIDRTTGRPISLALVRIVTADGHFVETFVSDETGRVLPKSQEAGQKLVIEKVGYYTMEQPLSQTGFIERKKFLLTKESEIKSESSPSYAN